ncbi:PilZ domain-containing protein [Sandaracinus amylolyticus]|uniref:PilZ domain-containing protein n=1 Tax=Sandaracinus amylolyticus TaxID=927083 RepID=UPI001F28AD28|nr:PilZ domain-containing protein [Sandaracinus amylolyticus]UJR85015.1 Hypothetical protein I5071_70940 [Sandaracinus amylolyticus]
MTTRNVLEMIFEYQLLRAKQDRLEVPLDDDERARLFGLGRLLTGDGTPSPRTMPRLPFPKTVSFTMPGGFESGEVKNLSGTGLAIATARPPVIGARVIVRLLDEAAGCEYFFPCRVIWARRANLPGMGLVFDGVPTRNEYLAEESTGVWRRAMRMGDPPREANVA